MKRAALIILPLTATLVACQRDAPVAVPLRQVETTPARVQDPSQIGFAVVGLSMDWDDETVERVAGYASAAGATWVRELMNWSQAQPNAIHDWADGYREKHHTHFAALRNRGLHLFVTLQSTPWYGCYPGATCDNSTAPQLGIWTDFVRDAVLEFPEVDAWGIYNEPGDFPQWHLGMSEWDPPYYGDRIEAYWKTAFWAGNTIHSWAPGKLVVAHEQGTGDGVWLRTLLQNAGASIDVISLHEYGTSWGAENDVGGADQIARSYRSQGWPIWVTEAGDVANGGFPNDWQQASHLIHLFQNTFSGRIVNWTKTFPWHLWKREGTADGYELIRNIDYNPPTFRMAYNCMVQLGNYQPVDPSCTEVSECDSYMTQTVPGCPGYPGGGGGGPPMCGSSPCELRAGSDFDPAAKPNRPTGPSKTRGLLRNPRGALH